MDSSTHVEPLQDTGAYSEYYREGQFSLAPNDYKLMQLNCAFNNYTMLYVPWSNLKKPAKPSYMPFSRFRRKNYHLKSICVNVWMLVGRIILMNKQKRTSHFFLFFLLWKTYFFGRKRHGPMAPFRYATQYAEHEKPEVYMVVFPSLRVWPP